jgi:hypothetical protein
VFEVLPAAHHYLVLIVGAMVDMHRGTKGGDLAGPSGPRPGTWSLRGCT